MAVFVWPAPFWAVVRRNRRGIDRDYGPRGHSGCCEKKVALPWRLAPKHLYLCTVACAGRKPHTQASEGAASRGVEKGGSEPRGAASLTWLRPFCRRVLSPGRSPVDLFRSPPSITYDHGQGGKWNLFICEPPHCLFKWGLETKMRSAGQESREN